MGNAYSATAAVNVYAQAPIPGCIASGDGEQAQQVHDHMTMIMNLLGKLYRINRRIYTYDSTPNTTPDHASE